MQLLSDMLKALGPTPIARALQDRILILDGAMGTRIQNAHLKASDFGGEALDGCNENLVLTRPDLIEQIHNEYLEAGADIVETNTFGGTPLVLAEYGLQDKTYEINVAAAKLARKAADAHSTPERPRFVAGSIGPTTKAISVTGGVTFSELITTFYEQARGLWDGGSDYFLLETCQDTRNLKAGLLALEKLFSEKGAARPVAVSATIEPMGTMLGGQGVESLLASVDHLPLLYLGLNCATGPEFMTDHIRTLARLAPFPVGCVPNAGLPDENGNYLETPEMLSRVIERFAESGWLNVVGGCCGTHTGHISSLHDRMRARTPRKMPADSSLTRNYLSGIDPLEITDELRPVIVGERTNVIGSRKFKELIVANEFDQASDIARAQIKSGAQIIDVCLANPDRDELADMRSFMTKVIQKVRAPFMIDSTDAKVIAEALTYCQGKAIINSINLEDGEERFEEIVPIARRFGAALVVGTIDDDKQQGMGVTRERKLAIAERSYKLLTEKYGVRPQDIYWDPLVFPCATGDENYVGSAAETIEGLRLIKKRFPGTRSVLGISNVSFGLPPAGREVLNSVFLYHCVQAGLDLAIVNSEKLERYASIPDEEKKLADDLLFTTLASGRHPDTVARFADHFRKRAPVDKSAGRPELPLLERLPRYIIEGSKDGLYKDLDQALAEGQKPLEIINGPLMKGMDEVGRLFNTNQLIVAEVLQSAEAMKAAVSYLEPHMDKAGAAAASRGKVVLATVKGDVHDIGKNLVEIIFANNGFEIVNLGIRVPPEQLIEAIREHSPQAVGLSGLLVKSAQQMVITADDLARAGIKTPILVGGAALSERFVDFNISPAYGEGTVAYARDAMSGLELAKQIVDPARHSELREKLSSRRAEAAASRAKETPSAPVAPLPQTRSSTVPALAASDLPQPPDLERHVLRNTPIEQIFPFINPLMLYGRHLGIKGGTVRLLERLRSGEKGVRAELQSSEPKALAIWEKVEETKLRYKATPLLAPRAVYQFFRATSSENSLRLHSSDGTTTEFTFPRQPKADGLCLSDYVAAGSSPSQDTVAMFAVSVGIGVRDEAERLKTSGDYLSSHVLQALAIECAEAYAEYLHSQLRKMWGFPDPMEITMMERFQAKYRGKRYSFGYPACPRLDDQALLWKLLKPQDIGIELTEGFMMNPESSVSAIVFHHPAATYFSVGSASDENR